MSMRPDAARGKVYGHNRDQIVSDWKEIVQKLNEMGPPQRTVTEWKKVIQKQNYHLNHKIP